MTYLFSSLVLFFIPSISFAHTRWFAQETLPAVPTQEPTAIYLSVWAIVALLIVGVGWLFEKRGILSLSFLNPRNTGAFERAASTFTMVFGAFLLIAGTHDYLFSPNITPAEVPFAFIVIQLAIGLAFLVGIFTRISAIALGLLWGTLFFFTSWVTALEDIWVLTSAVFILIMGNDYFSIWSSSFLKNTFAKFQEYALSILRIGVGLTLMTLGFSEKIFHPELGLSFLAQHQWNFMSLAGLPFSDYLFVLSAGSVEALFGLVFLLGIVTRLNALVVAVVFSTPLFILGPIELAGHMPHFAAVILLLLFGGGKHWSIVRKD